MTRKYILENPKNGVVIKYFARGISPTTRRFYDYIIWDNLHTKDHLFIRCKKFLEIEEEFFTWMSKNKALRDAKKDEQTREHDNNNTKVRNQDVSR